MSKTREIKFRAWDADFSVMCYMEDEYALTFTPNGWSFEDKDGVTSTKIGECELMQFTGLKDKNGKDIYEGDVISGRIAQRYGFVKIVAKVVSEHLGHCVAEFLPFGDGIQLSDITNCSPNECEVIGNVWESPELLAGK